LAWGRTIVTMTPSIGDYTPQNYTAQYRLYPILITTNPQEGKARRETTNSDTETEVIPTLPSREEDRQGKNRHPIVNWRL
jgi:hypothetical protein